MLVDKVWQGDMKPTKPPPETAQQLTGKDCLEFKLSLHSDVLDCAVSVRS